MASMVKLPYDLEEEILSRLPPRSLVQFRTLCKHWNSLFHDKSFLNNHLSRSRPQFMFLTLSKIYSIDIIGLHGVDPTVEVCELPYDFPYHAMKLYHTTIAACDGLLFRHFWKQGFAVWNPWLRQLAWIKYEDKGFTLCGVGYDCNKHYKILGFYSSVRRVSDTIQQGYDRVAIYECTSQALKFIDAPFTQWPTMDPLPVNGNLYWLTNQNTDTLEYYYIRSFDFSREIFEHFCELPCQMELYRSELVLAVFEGDRLSLLKQCYATWKVEIWVTKDKIGREGVVWINLMTFPTTKLPKILHKIGGICYFIYDKTLIMCCGDDLTNAACVYILRGDVLKKYHLESGIDFFCQSVYVPNFIPLPLEFRSLQV